MIKYFLLIAAIILGQSSTHAEDSAENEMKPQIGSIDDTGRVNPDEYKFSIAENILWMDKHLQNIEQPARLHYEFEKTGSYEDGFTDDVYLDVINVNEDGTRNTVLDFFTEDRKQKIAQHTVQNVTGNPVIGVYLQGDIYEMNRLTEGHWRYFQKQIKMAIADSKDTQDVTIDHDGQQYEGSKIIIHPYESAMNKRRLGEFSDKRYEFIFSDKIPGKLYQIKTVINNSEDAAVPLIQETLTLISVEYTPEVISKKVD